MSSSPPRRPRRALPALCVTQIVGWGVLYYAFPVMLPALTRDTGWPATSTTAAFSAALVVSALVGIPVGRLIDTAGPRWTMTAGSLLGAAAFALVAVAQNLLVFTIGWVLTGAAMAATFYQPAFAALTRWYGRDRVRALTTLTLAGGLASTVFAPVTATLTDHLGWRHATLTLAGVVLVIAAPLHAVGLRGPWPRHSPEHAAGSVKAAALSAHAITTSRPFRQLAVALTLSGFAMYAVVFGLIPLLTGRGASTSEAAWALGLGGLGQTLGRLLYAPVAARTSPRTRTAVLTFAGGATTALLAFLAGPIWLLTVVAMAAGMVRGNLTLLQATAVTDRWGTSSYGRLTAVLAAPVTIAGALAPWAVASLSGPLGGYANAFWLLAVLSLSAAAIAARVPTV
ncbi:MAG: MFS transporter [Dermatophilaceae bacterium]|nr:MFS transporter [Dermatophilaceae bacterium]